MEAENTDKIERRHRVGIDTVSLLDNDAEVQSAEEEVESNHMFMEMLRCLTTDRQRFIALSLFMDFNKTETAYMLKLTPAMITRDLKLIKPLLNQEFAENKLL